MRAAAMIRTASFPAMPTPPLCSSLVRSLSLSPRATAATTLQAKLDEKSELSLSPKNLRKARSETDLIVGSGRITIPAQVVEEEGEEECSGGGRGKAGTKVGGGFGGEGNEGRMAEYYEGLLRSDPGNPLLLRNYARFLHEVVGDARGAAEYYGRAILASPGDGELLSLYGKLVWETHRDEERAGAYFERAVEASPDDCYVLGSYADFLWDAEEDEEEEEKQKMAAESPLVEAF